MLPDPATRSPFARIALAVQAIVLAILISGGIASLASVPAGLRAARAHGPGPDAAHCAALGFPRESVGHPACLDRLALVRREERAAGGRPSPL